MRNDLPPEMAALLANNPAVDQLEVIVADINGVIRGKRLPIAETPTLFSRGINFSASVHLLDTRGRNIDGLRLGTEDGDPDFLCRPVPGSVAPVPWASRPLAQCLISMYTTSGAPYFAEARHVLEAVAARFAADGLTPVVATELEFYLLADSNGPLPELIVGRIPGTSTVHTGPQLYNVEDLHDIDSFLRELEDACRAQNLPATTAVSECAPGQFEVNLHHVADAVLACDHAVLLRRAVRGVARRHGLAATFMAKPFAEFAGSGLHVHVSLKDKAGANVFAPHVTGTAPGPAPGTALGSAVAGTLVAMAESMAIFAPNANSYRRFRPGAFAPVSANWGANHRNVAVRIPMSEPADTRLEHRVAGADANPYLAVAAILAGIHHGMSARLQPPVPVREAGPADTENSLPVRWEQALECFAEGRILPGYLGAEFCRVFGQCRRWEADQFHAQVGHLDYEWYLRVI
jgi:glutamine synthetase